MSVVCLCIFKLTCNGFLFEKKGVIQNSKQNPLVSFILKDYIKHTHKKDDEQFFELGVLNGTKICDSRSQVNPIGPRVGQS